MKDSENKYNFDPSILKALINQGPDFLMELFRLAMSETWFGRLTNLDSYLLQSRVGHTVSHKRHGVSVPCWRERGVVRQAHQPDSYMQ